MFVHYLTSHLYMLSFHPQTVVIFILQIRQLDYNTVKIAEVPLTKWKPKLSQQKL